MSESICNNYLKFVFYYTKTIHCSGSEDFKRVDSTSFNYYNFPDDVNLFIKNKIEALSLIGCDVFQVASYKVNELYEKTFEIQKRSEQIEIL